MDCVAYKAFGNVQAEIMNFSPAVCLCRYMTGGDGLVQLEYGVKKSGKSAAVARKLMELEGKEGRLCKEAGRRRLSVHRAIGEMTP
jgi:hypothetical protein